MKRQWLRAHYKKLPRSARRVLTEAHLRKDLRVIRAAVRKHPRLYALSSALTNLLVTKGWWIEAIRAWNAAAKQFSHLPNPYFMRARWAMERENFEEAQKYLRLCLARDRGYFRATAHFWRAESLFRLGRNASALDEIQYVPDDYEERWFLDYRRRSKTDLLRDILSVGT